MSAVDALPGSPAIGKGGVYRKIDLTKWELKKKETYMF